MRSSFQLEEFTYVNLYLAHEPLKLNVYIEIAVASTHCAVPEAVLDLRMIDPKALRYTHNIMHMPRDRSVAAAISPAE